MKVFCTTRYRGRNRYDARNIQSEELVRKILNACSALKYVFILLESGGGDHLSNGQDDIAKQSLTLLRPPFRDQLVSTREHKASSLVGIRSLTPARRPLTSRCVPRNVARFHETETRNVTRPIPSLNALIRFDPSLAILFVEWNNFVRLMRPRRNVLALEIIYIMCRVLIYVHLNDIDKKWGKGKPENSNLFEICFYSYLKRNVKLLITSVVKEFLKIFKN